MVILREQQMESSILFWGRRVGCLKVQGMGEKKAEVVVREVEHVLKGLDRNCLSPMAADWAR